MIPVGIAHQRSFPREPNPANPPPNNAPAMVPSEQSLVSYSTTVRRITLLPAISSPQGMVLVTGPTGSGKTTILIPNKTE